MKSWGSKINKMLGVSFLSSGVTILKERLIQNLVIWKSEYLSDGIRRFQFVCK